MNSVWSDTIQLPEFETLQGDRKTDVLIIGGGMAGILCAYFLREKGVDCMLVEGHRICSGVTKNTTAKITAQHGLYFMKMYQERSYVLALSGAAQVQGMYLDEAKRGLSFRNYRDLLLLGGGSHRTGKDGGNDII